MGNIKLSSYNVHAVVTDCGRISIKRMYISATIMLVILLCLAPNIIIAVFCWLCGTHVATRPFGA